MAGKKDKAAAKEAKGLMAKLLQKMSLTKVAADVMVSEASARRWQDGSHAPHPGALARLRELVEKMEKAEAKKVTA